MKKIIERETNITIFRDGLGIDNLITKGAELYEKQVEKAERRLLASVKLETNILKDIYAVVFKNSSGFDYECRFVFNLNGEVFERNFRFEDGEDFVKKLREQIAKVVLEKVFYKLRDDNPSMIMEIFNKK